MVADCNCWWSDNGLFGVVAVVCLLEQNLTWVLVSVKVTWSGIVGVVVVRGHCQTGVWIISWKTISISPISLRLFVYQWG